MSYIGNEPAVGQWRKLTDISSSFDGVTTTFTTSVPPGTSAYYVTAGSASQLIISLGGVIQEPDVDYTVNTNTITFTTAPASGLSFFGVLCGDALNVGTPGDGSVTTSKLGTNLSVDLTSGSAATPSLTFDANTGLYSPGEDQVAISTGGTGRLFVDSSGRVGLGTSSPSYKLDCSGNARFTTNVDITNANANSYIYFGRTGTNAQAWSIGNVDTSLNIFNQTSFFTALSIDSSGRVGIGTTSPGKPLDVRGTGSVNVGSFSNGTQGIDIATTASGGSIQTYDQNQTLDLKTFGTTTNSINFSVGSTERARIDSSGRLLVGTSSSSDNVRLVVQGRTTTDTTGQGVVHVQRGSSGPGNIGAGSGLGDIHFADSNGYIAASISGQADGTWGAGGSDYPGRLLFSTTADSSASPTERMRIRATGVVGTQRGLVVGSLSGGINDDALIISSAVIASGAGTNALKWNSSSGVVTYDTSSRLIKENIEDCPYGIDAIKLLQPRKYFRTDDQRNEIGFVADELVNVLPEFVPIGPKSVITKNEEDTEDIPLGVNYEKLTAVLTKALQEAVGRIETLEAEVAALKAS